MAEEMHIEREISREEQKENDYCYIKISRNIYDILDKAGRLIRDIFRFSIKFTVMYMLFKYVLHI